MEEIERDWRATSAFPAIMVDAFERVERVLGREWIAALRERYGVRVQGPAPLLEVVSMGGRLSVLDAIEGTERLVSRLKRSDASAEAELTAMHLLHCRDRSAEIELDPDVVAGKRVRKADFRIRVPGEDWTYVEVARPDISEAGERVAAILGRITDVVLQVKREFGLEVFFSREPEEDEIEPLLTRVRQLCADGRAGQEEADGLALLILSDVRPGLVTPHQESGEPTTPRLGMAKYIGGGDEPRRHIVARVPYADKRADKFLAREAAQLPTGHPGLIMVDAGGEPTLLASWTPMISRWFRPGVRTWVSGLCLFAPHILPVRQTLLWVAQVRLLVNPHGQLPLPHWLEEALKEAAHEFQMCSEAARRPA